MRIRTAPMVITGILLLIMSGCAAPDGDGRGDGPGTPSDGDPAAVEFERRAEEVAGAWRESDAAAAWRAGFLPLDPLAVLPGGELGEDIDAALAAGWLRLRAGLDLSPQRPDDGEVVYHDGDAEPVPLISPAQAWEEVHGGAPLCPDPRPSQSPSPRPTGPDAPVSAAAPCTVLEVVGVEAGTVPLRTSRGTADVPAWVFDLAETEEPLARVAVAPEAVTAVPRLEGINFPHQSGLATAMSLARIEDAELTYRLGIGSCDNPPAPLVHEADDVVVVGGTASRVPGAQECPDNLVIEEVTVSLDAAVADRPVLATTGEVLAFGRR